MVEKATADFQMNADHCLPDLVIARACRATTRSGQPCKAHPLAGSDLCEFHTPGLAAERGRRGGLRRRLLPARPDRGHPRFVAPKRKPAIDPEDPPFVLPDVPLDSAEHIAEVSAAAIAAVAAGTMDPRQGTALSQMLERHRKVIETVDYAKRLAAIEAAVGAGKAST